MERPGYRENLELLNELFPDRQMLTVKDVATFIGCDYATARKCITFNSATHRVSKADLARQITAT